MYWITAVLVVYLSYVYTQLSGYLMHYLMHKFDTEAHRVHHEVYTPDDYTSEKYRSPGWGPTLLQHAMYAIPIVPALALTAWLFPIVFLPLVLGVMGATALASAYIHDAFHIEGHWLCSYAWFNRLKYTHKLHHVDPETNLGIFDLTTDKMFKSYQ